MFQTLKAKRFFVNALTFGRVPLVFLFMITAIIQAYHPLATWLIVLAAFFIGIASAWTMVYIPEVFPTERRATCTGWVSSIGRIAYVAGPALAAVLLKAFPAMTGFWVAAGLVMLVPVGIVWLADPAETSKRELEEI